MKLCECGCKKEVAINWNTKLANRFIVGHSRKGKKQSPETILKRIKKIIGKKRLDLIGKPSWNKGISPSIKTIEKMKLNHKGMKGLNHSIISRKKMSESHIGQKISRETKRKLRDSMIQYIEKTRNVKFSPNIGKYEDELFKRLQLITKFKIKKCCLDGYFPDGYISELNVIIELDELAHDNISMIDRHKEREDYLIETFHCKFFRVKEKDWLVNKENVIQKFIIFMNEIEMELKGDKKMKVELISITPDAEKLIEDAGRTCYQSEAKGQVGDLIQKLIRSGHHSVLEHASATFRISEVSRALTHQLVRHRLCAFSQQSQRYVNEKQFDYVIPPSIIQVGGDSTKKIFHSQMQEIQKMYDYWKNLGIKNEDARFVLPNACYTEIVISANLREFRHIFDVRCDKHAQWEIRKCALLMLAILSEKTPNVFKDLKEKFLTN